MGRFSGAGVFLSDLLLPEVHSLSGHWPCRVPSERRRGGEVRCFRAGEAWREEAMGRGGSGGETMDC